MEISERELNALTNDLDEMHHDALPKMHSAAEELVELNGLFRGGIEKLGATATSRRTFLLGAGAVAGGLTLAACGGKSSNGKASGGGGNQKLSGDLSVAALAASLENLAVQTYQAGLDAASKGALGAVPPAVATFAMTAQSHHRDHAAAWNSILTKAGKNAITGVDQTVNDAVVKPGFAEVKDVVGLAKFALGLENVAAATYLNGIQNAISDKGAIAVAASIQPVEMQHAAILNFVLGQYPIPDAFAKTDGARGPDDKIG